MLSFGQTDRKTDRRKPVKQYAPDLSMLGHKNLKMKHQILAKIVRFGFYGIENIVGKGQMLVSGIFSFSPNIFKSFSTGSLKRVKGKQNHRHIIQFCIILHLYTFRGNCLFEIHITPLSKIFWVYCGNSQVLSPYPIIPFPNDKF